MKRPKDKVIAGLDLHSNNVMIGLINQDGQRLAHRKVGCQLSEVVGFLQPWKEQLQSLAVESTFNWYWLVDGLSQLGYPIQLANPARIEQYSGLKHADDEDDAYHLAELQRLKILPTAHIYDRQLRPVRDLLRRRVNLVHQRTALFLNGNGSVLDIGIWTVERLQMGPRGYVHHFSIAAEMPEGKNMQISRTDPFAGSCVGSQMGDEGGVGWGLQMVLQNIQDFGGVSRQQRVHRQRQSGEMRAANNVLPIRSDRPVLILMENKPVKLSIQSAPDQVLANAGAAVGAKLVMKINRHTAGGDFHDQFGRATNVARGVFVRASAIFRQHSQKRVRLRHVFGVEAHGAIGSNLGPGRAGRKQAKPCLDQ